VRERAHAPRGGALREARRELRDHRVADAHALRLADAHPLLRGVVERRPAVVDEVLERRAHAEAKVRIERGAGAQLRPAEDGVAIRQLALQRLPVEPLVGRGPRPRAQQPIALGDRALPVHERLVLARGLAVEIVVELRGRVHRAVVHVHGREEEPARNAPRELERHRMHRARLADRLALEEAEEAARALPGLQLEDAEAPVVVRGQLLPDVVREAEARIEAAEVARRGHERRFEVADVAWGTGDRARRRTSGTPRDPRT